jgi:hypothetical protein
MDPLGLISPFDTQLAMLAHPIQAVEISLASKSRRLHGTCSYANSCLTFWHGKQVCRSGKVAVCCRGQAGGMHGSKLVRNSRTAEWSRLINGRLAVADPGGGWLFKFWGAMIGWRRV